MVPGDESMVTLNRSSLVLALMIAGSSAATDSGSSIQSAIDTLRQTGTLEVVGETICAPEMLVQFYERRAYAQAWTARESSRAGAEALLAAITRAHEDGLDPYRYHLVALRTLSRDRARQIDRDLLLTDAFFLLSSHLLAGSVDPESLVSTWCLQPRGVDLAGALETALDQGLVAATLARMVPSYEGYRLLRRELKRLRTTADRGSWPVVPEGPPIRLGDTGERVDRVTDRLRASGDLSGSPRSFDDTVDHAVRRFQRLHGITEDGIVGPETLRELNVPAASRIRQIELNLERWRWLPERLGDPYLLVNIPEFRLRAIEGERTVLSMRIIVGTEYRQTPVFSASMKRIVFSPYWNVPDRIAREELWPRIHRDRGYLSREHLEVLEGGRLRQKPGPWNALGDLKFLFPNRYDVYLHDTPARQLFDESHRAFSHGCMRIEKPVDLAQWLLRASPEWSRDRIVEQSQKGVEHILELSSPVEVHVLYWTAFVSEDGELHFAPDVYGQDRRLDEAMK